MRHHIALKFIAVLLATLSLFTVAASAVGAVCLASMNLYEESVDMLYEENMAALRRQFSVDLIHRYASLKLGSIPERYLSSYHNSSCYLIQFLLDQRVKGLHVEIVSDHVYRKEVYHP